MRRFYADAPNRISMRHAHMHVAYLKSALRAPLGVRDKAVLIAFVTRRAVWARRELAQELRTRILG
jgi:hypothetical protein